jgi:hypothetical protein
MTLIIVSEADFVQYLLKPDPTLEDTDQSI